MNIKKTIKYAILILLLSYFVTGYAKGLMIAKELTPPVSPQEALQDPLDSLEGELLITHVTEQYGADTELIKKITWCESGYQSQVIHDGGHGKGMTGIQRATFEHWKKTFNRPELRYESNYDQLVIMSLAFNAGDKYRNQWTTYVAYKNGGTYSFYSRQLQGYFTARCS